VEASHPSPRLLARSDDQVPHEPELEALLPLPHRISSLLAAPSGGFFYFRRTTTLS